MRWILVATLAALSADAATVNEAELAAFFDKTVPTTLTRYHVPGAVVSVVKDGELLYAGGYGVANLESGSTIDPATSTFRLASLSKLITATAVMQLVEQGKLVLDADVNDYLSGGWLPDFDGQPVTLRQLLTHSAGFDERFLGMASPNVEGMEDLGDYLRRRMPPRVFAPGVAISYSNHGVALAGLIVEEVSGQPYDDYVQEHIFDPLGMTTASFHRGPEDLDAMATGYDYKAGTHTPAPYDYPNTPPASTLAATAEDMARFMIAHLDRDPKLMAAATYETMHRSPFRHHPEMPGRSIGFAEADYNGLRVLQHTGLIWGYSSLLMLLPDQDVGLFVSVTTDATGAYGRIRGAFLNEFFPDTRKGSAAPAAPADSAARIAAVEGAYLHSRRVRSTFLKFATLVPQFADEISVAAGDAPGEIIVNWPRTKRTPRSYTEVSPWYFRGVPTNDTGERRIAPGAADLAFLVDAAGTPTHLTMGSSAFDRIPWYQAGNFLIGVLACAVVILVLHLVTWPLTWRRRRNATDDDSLRWLRRTVTGAAVLLLGFMIGIGVVMLQLHPYAIPYGPPQYLPSLLLLPMLAMSCAFAAAALVLMARLKEWGTPGARIYYGAVTTSVFILLALLSYWNLLGYQYG